MTLCLDRIPAFQLHGMQFVEAVDGCPSTMRVSTSRR